MRKLFDKKGFGQVVRFGVVGVFNTLVDYGFFYIFISFANLHKSVAQVLSTSLAMCGSFFLNRRWTFGCNGRGNVAQIVKFLAVNLLAMLTVILLTHLFYDIMHLEVFANAALASLGVQYVVQGDIAVMLCKVVASGLSLIINFFGNKFWVFGAKKQTKTGA